MGLLLSSSSSFFFLWKLLSHVHLFLSPMDCSLSGSSVHRILQARILEWVAIPFSRGSSQPRDWTSVSYITGRFFTIWATRETTSLQKAMYIYIHTRKELDMTGWLHSNTHTCLWDKVQEGYIRNIVTSGKGNEIVAQSYVKEKIIFYSIYLYVV